MIFYKFSESKLGNDPATAYSSILDNLVGEHTDNVFEAFMPCNVVLRKDNIDFKLDDEIIRYADTNIVIYGLEEKVDPDYFHIAMQFTTAKGHEQMMNIMKSIEAHPACEGRVRGLRLVGVISDDPQCIPCMKRRMERENNKRLVSASELFINK